MPKKKDARFESLVSLFKENPKLSYKEAGEAVRPYPSQHLILKAKKQAGVPTLTRKRRKPYNPIGPSRRERKRVIPPPGESAFSFKKKSGPIPSSLNNAINRLRAALKRNRFTMATVRLDGPTILERQQLIELEWP